MQKEKENQKEEHGNNPVLRLTINGKTIDCHKQYIYGIEIREIGSIPADEELYLAVKQPGEVELILNDTKINLARPEIEHFYSKKKEYKVLVNTREKIWTEDIVTFEQIIVLAFGKYDDRPNIVYTLTYDKGPKENREGSMIKGSKVFVKNNMIFNVTVSDKS